MRAAVSLLCVALWVTGCTAAPTKGQNGGSKPASVDDVNVLTYGVLQFSDTIHNVYKTTDRRMARVNTSLRNQEGVLKTLQEETQQATQTEDEIRDNLAHLQLQTAELYTQAAQMKMMLQRAEREEAELQKQVTRLETTIKSSTTKNITTLKDLAQQHSNVLKVLVKWIQEQRLTLVDQDRQLSKLQSLAKS